MAGASLTGVPVGALEEARSTLGAAVAVARQLSDHSGSELAALATGAFTASLEFAAITSAAIVLPTAVLLLVSSRLTKSSGASNAHLSHVGDEHDVRAHASADERQLLLID
jgi:MFS transporter, DHA2 family, multidrug resistance protein